MDFSVFLDNRANRGTVSIIPYITIGINLNLTLAAITPYLQQPAGTFQTNDSVASAHLLFVVSADPTASVACFLFKNNSSDSFLYKVSYIIINHYKIVTALKFQNDNANMSDLLPSAGGQMSKG